MHKMISIALTIVLNSNGVNADALHRNPDQLGKSLNMTTYGATTIPIGAYEYCNRFKERCNYSVKDTKLSLSREIWDTLVKINYQVNREIKPMTDFEIFGVQERWELPEKVGDCEDYVLEKKRRLTEIGVTPGALRVTVVYDADNGGHAVLTVVTDLGDFILDNNNNQVLRWQDAELTYLKRQLPGDLTSWERLKRS